MSTSAQVPFEVDFGIEIDFKPNSPDPARVYRAMTSLIEACQSIDIKLAQTVGPQIRPVLFLEDIRTGSLTTFLRSALESVDDDAIKNLEWKKLVGSYLVKGKRVMVDYLRDRETIQNSKEIYDLQGVIVDAAREKAKERMRDDIQLQRMTTKWASCSTTGRICFSTELLDEPTAFREVVIVHELLHLLVPNHGKLFKSLMNAYLPGWEKRVAGRANRLCGSRSAGPIGD